MERAQAVEDPRFATPVGNVCERREPPLALRGIRRQRWHNELQARFPIGILGPGDLLFEDASPRRHFTQGQILRQRDEVRFGQRQAGDALAARPDPRQPGDRGGRPADVSKRGEVGAFYALRRCAIESGFERGFNGRRAPVPLGVRSEFPECLTEVAEDSLDVQFVLFARQRRQRQIDETRCR